MKKLLLLWMTALVVTLGLQAQRSYTFNVAAYNVDGLPITIAGVQVNAGGGEAEGATQMGNALKGENWEIVGLSEDFNFHDELVAPLTDYYHVGTHGGKVSVSSLLGSETDGLGLLVANRGTFPYYSDETRVEWNDVAADEGSDGMVTKGFRYYAVTLDDGIVVDVYVLHMDAGGSEADIACREKQLAQLRDHIAGNNKGRHIFVIGDTNCRYTRENLKSIFIDGLHELDNTLTVRDVWVEKVRGGEYPTYGTGSLMVNDYGYQKGEVVDKIFWIENSSSPLEITANLYECDVTFPVTDHFPVLGNFTITDLTGDAVDSWTVDVDEKYAAMNLTLEGDLASAGTYYLMNVETGTYLKPGANYGVQATLGSAAQPITLEASGSGFIMKTALGSVSTESTPYLDNAGASNIWTFEAVSGTEYQYYIKCSAGSLTGTENKAIVTCASHTGKDTQKWILFSEARLKSEMGKATAKGINITPLIKDADFDVKAYNGTWNNYAYNWSNFEGNWALASAWEPTNTSNYWSYAYYSGKAAESTISQSLTNMPAGSYKLTYQGFYRYTKTGGIFSSSTTEQTMSATVTLGTTSANLNQYSSVAIGGFDEAATEFLTGANEGSISHTLSSQGTLDVKVYKPATTQGKGSGWNSSYTYDSWVVIDNFQLYYYGADVSDEDIKGAVKADVGTYINEAWAEVQAMGPEAEAAFDLSTLVYRYENGLISEDGDAEKAIVDQAVAVSKAAANQATIEDALESDSDITGLIENPSFETGDFTGWQVGYGWDVKVHPNSNSTYTTTDCHGDYLFNSYAGDAGHTSSVKQTINGLPNGLYELKAMVTSFGDGEYSYKVDDVSYEGTANTVFLVGNSYHKGVKATDKTEFIEGTLYFLVEDGTATIGAIGGNKGPGNEFKYYWPWEGCFFKADNFRLKYVCNTAHGRLKLALDEANEANLDEYGQAALDVATYQAMYDNKSLTSDGKAEAAAVRAALQTAAKAQKTKNADMTYAITNPNFETGDYTGWACSTGGDTQAAPQDNTTYAVAGSDGRFLFNTWTDGNTAQPLTQTVTGLANGTYTLTAMVASDSGNNIQLTANGESTTVAAASAKSLAVFPSVTCEVTDGKLDIQVMGVDNVWYKADDFRLTYLGRELTLNETDTSISYEDGWYTSVVLNRNVKANTWNTFVVPFNMEIPSGWTVKELSSATQVGDVISMTFSDASSIEAGTPYMVKTSSVWSSTTIENTDVTSVLNDVDGSGIVTFKGNYISRNVPTDAFFISGNKFYQAINENNTLKAFRGYFEATGAAGVNVLNFTFDDEVTGIDTTVADPTAEVIAIYSLDGRRIESLQRGVNIVKLSNGKTKKLIVK